MAPGDNPFVGMRTFGYEERDRFFGREQQSYALYRLLSFGFIAVIGNSGSGKSSLVRAGLLPILLGGREPTRWRVATMTPGGEPLERLGEAIADLGPREEDDDARSIRRERIAYRIRLSSSGIADALEEMPHLSDDSVLLIVDQFEEIFRNAGSSSSDENELFVQQLLELHRRRPNARVLITMRSDFIGDCARFPGLPEAVSDTQYLVPTLTREQRRAAICKPIAAANATIEPDLVERLLNEEDFGSDLLPILQHALARMWIVAHGRSPGAVAVTDADYRAVGRLDGAISRHADDVLRGLDGLGLVAESVFRALSQRDLEGRATRRVLSLRQLVAETGLPEGDVIAVVDRFRAPDCSFLLPAEIPLTSDVKVDVVHEALLRRWERMTSNDAARAGWLDREWLDGQYYRSLLARIDSGETTLQLDRVTERYAWWTGVPHTSAWTMRYGGRHDRVDAFFAASLAALAESDRAKARAEAEERERQKQKERATRRFLIVTGSIATIAIVLLAVTFFALLGSQRTTNSSLVTQSKLVARDAESLADRGNATDAALLALEVLPQHVSEPDRPFTWAAYGALTDALANMREVRDYRLFGTLSRMEYSRDGSRFIAHQSDGTIWIWKLGAPSPERVYRAQAFAGDVEFSPDGTLVASGSNDGSVHLWNVRTGKLVRAFRAARGFLDETIFTPDGRRLLTSSFQDDTTDLYDVATGRKVREVRGSTQAFMMPTVGTAGKRILTVEKGSVTLWDVGLTKAQRVFSSPPLSVVQATLSLDESKLAVAYADNSTRIYDARSGRSLVRLSSRDQTVYAIRFTTDAKRLMTIGDSSARIWDTANGAVLATIPSNIGVSQLAKLSRDGDKIVLADADGSLGVYSTTLGARLISVAANISDVGDADFAPDGRRLLVASDIDGTVREWDISTNTSQIVGTTIAPDASGKNTGTDLAVPPSGNVFAVASESDLRVYDARSGKIRRTLRGAGSDEGTRSAFSPDGRTLIFSREYADSGIESWDWLRSESWRPLVEQTPGEPYFLNLVYAPDGKRIVSTARGVIRIRAADTYRVGVLVSANHHTIGTVQFSPDGKRLVAGSNDGWIRVYDARSGRRILAFRGHDNWVLAVRFSPDGRLIASASKDQSVRIWRAVDGSRVASLDTNGAAHAIEFSSDGKRLLIGADDGARIWDVATGRTIVAFRGFVGAIEDAAFALHDTRVVTIGADNTVRLWTVPELPACQRAIDEAHRRLAHALTPSLRDAEFITPRRTPSVLNALLPQQICS